MDVNEPMAQQGSIGVNDSSKDPGPLVATVRKPPRAFSVGGETEVKEDVPFYRRHKCLLTCCGITVALIVALVIVIIILTFTLFKTKQPVITVNNVVLDDLQLGFNFPSIGASFNLTLGLDISVWNPNHVSFKYTNSTSHMFYHGTEVGQAPIPAGRIGARGTEGLTTNLTLLGGNVLSNLSLVMTAVSDFKSGSFPVSTSTEVSGRVNILNIFKHHARSFSYCNMAISIASRSVENMTCDYHVKL